MIFMEPFPGVVARLVCSQGGDYRSSGSTRFEGGISMNVRTLIGESVQRAEDFRFLQGAGSFVDDLKRAGMLHAAVLRSPVAHGGIRRIDARAARTLPGVHAVVTAAEIGAVPVIPLRLANLPEFKSYLQPVIAKDKVRYVGEPVAVVVAETQALAEDAL